MSAFTFCCGAKAGPTITSELTDLEVRSGEIPVEALKVHVVDEADGVKLIVNTRTSLTLGRYCNQALK